MKSFSYFLGLLVPVLFFSCFDDGVPDPFVLAQPADPDIEYIIFGRHTTIGGGHHDLFLLTRTGLYKDATEITPAEERRFLPDALPDSLFQRALPLFDYPRKLADKPIWGEDNFGGAPDGRGRCFFRTGPLNGDVMVFFNPTDATTPEWIEPFLEDIERAYCLGAYYRAQVNRCE